MPKSMSLRDKLRNEIGKMKSFNSKVVELFKERRDFDRRMKNAKSVEEQIDITLKEGRKK